jgi:predicted nucleic acid-binding protein
MNGNYFLDTNILVYIHDRQSPVKQKLSKQLLYSGLRSGNACISSQVISEYFVTTNNKLQLPYSEILQIIHQHGQVIDEVTVKNPYTTEK